MRKKDREGINGLKLMKNVGLVFSLYNFILVFFSYTFEHLVRYRTRGIVLAGIFISVFVISWILEYRISLIRYIQRELMKIMNKPGIGPIYNNMVFSNWRGEMEFIKDMENKVPSSEEVSIVLKRQWNKGFGKYQLSVLMEKNQEVLHQRLVTINELGQIDY